MDREYDTRNVHYTGEMVGRWLAQLIIDSIAAGDKTYQLRWWDPYEGWCTMNGEISDVKTIPVRDY